ncbi:S-adenosyl-L-methionine-dependent methyltransferase [Ganoderma leucocontextum]|nr:S-adenosyl-L-methionine-dependent methyltransferase [Ganoderma leucocontextum]
MSSHAPTTTSKSNTFHVALTRVAAIGVLLVLSLITWAYRRALEPQYGSAPPALHLSKIVWSASILGSFAPSIPLSRATLGLAFLLYALPTSSYWAAAYTARLGDPIWGPVATHLIVLLPVLSLGVALVKALQEAPYTEEKATPQSSITLPVCATAITALQGLWPAVAVVNALPPNQVFLHAGTAAMTFWAMAPFLPDLSAPPPGATQPLDSASNPQTSSDPKGKRKKGSSDKATAANPTSTAPPPKRNETSASAARIRLALIPILPYLTRTILRGPTLPQPLPDPWTHPSYPLRILSSEQSTLSGVVVVGESLESPDVSTGIEHMRYLRAGHSLLGGVWVGPKVTAMDPELVLKDQAGNELGDSVYTAFILQEAALLAKKADNARPKNALIIGLGTGISATSFIRHGLSTTIVEIDHVVYDAAKRFFGLPTPDHVFLEDARGWVHNRSETAKAESTSSSQTSDPFDIVVHDCFSGGGIPAHLYTQRFWEELKSIVRSDAVVAVNYAGIISSDSAKAVVLTLRSVFPQCRAFYDSLESSADALNEFQNWVFFCTPSSDPLKFRATVSSDFLGSYLRRHVLSSLSEREGDISTLGSDIPAEKRERFVLTDMANPLGEWQQKDALHHWSIMRGVLPEVFWETY